MRHRLLPLAAVALAVVLGGAMPRKLQADEGMWLLNDPPRSLLKKKYDFDLTDAWLQRAMKASVRLNSGGSGAFVSPDGLLVTNHHVGADSMQKLNTPERDLLRDGFYAKTRKDELKCQDLEINVLQEIVDVTEKVHAAVKPGASPADAFAARRAEMARIEKESLDKTGLRSDVVTLYQGALYHLYRYKKYTDVRLVFAPESAAAAFGGDVDNFEFPRFGFDVCFFRAYENDKPVKVEHYLKWSKEGPKAGDLVFVTGHPGTTQRLETLARLLHRRDESHPYTLARVRSMEAALSQYSEQGAEKAAMAATDLHRVANARKAFAGQYQGLLDAGLLARRAADEKKLRDRFTLNADPGEADPWRTVEAAQRKLQTFETEFFLFERGDAFYTELFGIARHLVRLRDELKKSSGDRLREYRDSNLESLRFQLFSTAPIHAELERVKLAASLTFLAENLGGEHPMVVKVLAGKSPAVRAAELVAGTKLFDAEERKKLAEKLDPKTSKDTMIQLAHLVDAEARRLRKGMETEVEEPERQAYARIAKVRFDEYGRTVAPDATFTLRLAFGVVKGYEVDGTELPFATTFAGAYDKADKHGQREPFNLPERWLKGKTKVSPATPFNFVTTADTIGGNSGSPVLNRDGELVGINFDRNRHGLVRNFVYTEVQARHIAVHCRSVLEALPKLYDAGVLVKELEGK